MIAVMGATGNTGRNVVELLLAAGEQVRAIGRSETKLAELQRAGAEPFRGDATDRAFLTRAFRGADAVYTLLATDRRASDYRRSQDQEGETIAQALRESGVRYVVCVSSLGAELPAGTGPIAGLRAQEERVKQIDGLNVLFLRPTWFFENFYEALPVIKHEGIVADSLRPDLPFPMIAARDVAEVAAKALHTRDWKGHMTRELLGQRDLTQTEATRMLGERIGKPDLAYVQLSADDMAQALMTAGLSESFARSYVEMTRAVNDGTITPRVRTAENTTPTRFEDFASEWARAYHEV